MLAQHHTAGRVSGNFTCMLSLVPHIASRAAVMARTTGTSLKAQGSQDLVA